MRLIATIMICGTIPLFQACSDSATVAETDAGGTTEGPTACEGACSACSPFICQCVDGTGVRGCACSGSTCADESFCPSSHACVDHGGVVSGAQPGNPSPDGGRDTGSTPTVSEVKASGKLAGAAPITSGGYTLLTVSVAKVTYAPDSINGFEFASSGFSSADLKKLVVDSPSAAGCSATIQLGLGLGNATLSVSGNDASVGGACNKFINAIWTSGLTGHVDNIPFQSYKIPKLSIVFAGH